MTTWAIGDVHGQLAVLARLFARLDFDLERDRLWLVGDLVNRGPSSVGVLRWARQMDERLGARFVAVLGNHDLRLLACGAGIAAPRRRDTVDDVLEAPDRDELLAWLRRRPLCHLEGGHLGNGDLLVHAGLLPAWSVAEAARRAREAELALAADDELLADWHLRRTPEDPGRRRRRRTLEVLTGIRTCTAVGELCDWSGPPAGAPEGCRPWFAWEERQRGARVIFGHWAALGLHLASGVCGLDSGAAWGGRLTALCLEDGEVVQEEVGEGC